MSSRVDCRCGAIRQDSQLGLEPTPEEYVANMVAVFREVRRVLRSDGTVWLNLGDSYASPIGGNNVGLRTAQFGAGNEIGKKVDELDATRKASSVRKKIDGLKPKDLVGIPWRVAFALQADGWYLRSDIIWSKPNPMPESVTDRPTKAHEYLFLLSKSPRYYFDADAVRETNTVPDRSGTNAARVAPGRPYGSRGPSDEVPRPIESNPAGRNIRSVWTIATAPYPGAHFATFPPKLVEPCIKAGCPEGGVVLDSFAGSGTTGMVAQSLSRRAVLIDLSMDYLGQLMERNRDIPLGLGA
jgi:DNA modification methylase